MSHTLIDLLVGFVLFGFGLGWTVFRYASRNRLAMAVAAILSPLIAVIAVVFVLFNLVARRELHIGPCPEGLPEAERLVEEERQKLFGGEAREPSYSRTWQRAYEAELQRELTQVQRIAQRVFAHA